MRELIRTVRLRPYLKGKGPTFTLRLFDTGRVRTDHKAILAYEFLEGREVIFSGADFGVPTMDSLDGDRSVAGLLGFLTLRPGDTDADYFAGYTERQRRFCDEHAETLACEAAARFEHCF